MRWAMSSALRFFTTETTARPMDAFGGHAGSAGKRAQLRKALLRLGYRFWEESDNPAYLEYLGRLNTD